MLQNRHLCRMIIALGIVIMLPALASAAGGGGHADSGAVLKDFIYRCFNFLLMVGLLAYFVTKPIRKGLKERRVNIEKTLAEAEQAKAAAEAKQKEYTEKLAKAAQEIEGITASIRREGEKERDKIIASAQALAEKIEQEAESKATGVVARAQLQLREEAVQLAVDLARDLLNKEVSAQDQKRLVDEYMQKMGELH